jgi:hypothetical protein
MPLNIYSRFKVDDYKRNRRAGTKAARRFVLLTKK